MNTLETLLGYEWNQTAGWVLLHFLWQGTSIGLLLFSVLSLLPRRSAQVRYVAACAALVLMLLAPLSTLIGIESARHASVQGPQPPRSALDSPAAKGFWKLTPALSVVGGFSRSWLDSIREGVSPWLPLLTGTWFCGVVVLSVRLAGGWCYAQRLVRNGTRPLNSFWQERLGPICSQSKVRQSVRLLESARAQVPAVIGWLRPVVLLPASALAGLTPGQLETILAHELAHIRRHDYVVNLLQTVMETLLFYHPAVWWVSRQVRLEREHCCDDLAVASGGDPIGYARALTALEALRVHEPRLVLAVSGGSLLRRIERLVSRSEPGKNHVAAWLGCCITATAAVTLAAGAHRQNLLPKNSPVFLADPNETLIQHNPIRPPLPARPLLEGRKKSRGAGPRERVLRHMAYLQEPTKRGEQQAERSSESATTPAKEGYIAELRRLGYTDLSVDELITLKSRGITPEFIEGLRAEGHARLSVEELVRLRNHGVTPDYVRGLKASGHTGLDVGQLTKLRMHGLTPEWIGEMGKLGFAGLPLEALVSARQHGVGPEFVQGLRSLGFEKLTMDDVVRARAHGVDATFVKELRAAGLATASLEDSIKARQHGVTATFAKEFASLGSGSLSLDELVKLRNHGVNASFIKELRATGFATASVQDSIKARQQGVTPAFAKEIASLGYGSLSLDQLIKLRNHGVNGDFIRGLQQEGYERVPFDDIIRLRNHGVTAEFIRRMKSQGFSKLSVEQLVRLRMAGL